MIFNVNDKVNQNVLISCDHGLMIVNRFDGDEELIGVGHFLLDHGNDCSQEAYICQETIKHLSKPIVFDVGANIGTFTNWIARAFPDGTIVSIEPQRRVFQILNGNIAINNLYNCYTHQAAIGVIVDPAYKIPEPDYSKRANFGMYSLSEETVPHMTGNFCYVPMTTIDEMVSGKGGYGSVDLIKIDVEGMEIAVLRGAADTIRTRLPILFIEHSRGLGTTIKDEIKETIRTICNGPKYEFTLYRSNILCVPKVKE